MNNLTVRILTAVIAGGVSVTLILLSWWGLMIFCALISLLGMYELYRMADLKSRLAKFGMLGFGLLVWGHSALVTVQPQGEQEILRVLNLVEYLWSPIFAAVFGLLAVILLWEKNVRQPLREIGVLVFGFFYVFLPIKLLYAASLGLDTAHSLIGDSGVAYSFRVPLGILFLTWALDSMAYFGGKFLGKHPLWPRISPKKTWEGTVAGAAASIGLGVLLESLWPVHFSWIVVGAIIAVFSQLGDLVESMIKRGLNLKDSGGILPGHGGLLDRFDGMLVSVPLIYLYVAFDAFLASM